MSDCAMVHAGNVLADDLEALYGPPFASAERFGDYTHLVPVAQFHRDLDLPACLPERVEGYSVADEPRRGWPAPGPEQGRLLA